MIMVNQEYINLRKKIKNELEKYFLILNYYRVNPDRLTQRNREYLDEVKKDFQKLSSLFPNIENKVNCLKAFLESFENSDTETSNKTQKVSDK